MKKILQWVMLAAFFICGASAFTSCSNNDDNPVVDNSLSDGTTYTITAHLTRVEKE